MMKEKPQFECIGEFPLIEAKRITALFQDAGIPYEGEVDDTEIKRLNPGLIPAYGGTAGLGCKMRLFVPQEHRDEADGVLRRLFPV
jgi:hypothetical protein